MELSPEEREFISNELLAPAPVETIAAQVQTPDMARQVYAVSLIAITVDTDAERTYLAALARKLGLNPEVVQEMHTNVE